MSENKAQLIKHQGIVEVVSGRKVDVRILQASACSSCAAAQLCRSSEAQEKIVTALCPGEYIPSVGEQVILVGKLSQGMWATVWAYIVPLVLLLAVLMLAIRFTGSEGVAALLALCSLFLYYTVLYFFRDKLQKRLMFVVQRL